MQPSVLSQLAQRTSEPPINWLMASALSNPRLVSLAAGFTDSDSLPVRETRQLLATLLRRRRSGQAALQYGSTAGDPELRRLTCERIHRLDDAAAGSQLSLAPSRYDPARVLITSGSQQLLYLACECLCDPGDVVLVEDPTYFVFLSILQSHGIRCRGIRTGHDGLDPDHLERQLETLRRNGALRRLKFLYLVSYFQNPTGITTSFENKRRALALLRRYERYAGHRLFLLEDAAYRELRFAGQDTPSALTLPGAQERVLYAGTYSKPFATGMRVGFGVVPEALRPTLLRLKGNHDFGTTNLLQHVLRDALASGQYERHLPVLRRRYTAKARTMAQALRRHFPTTATWQQPNGGLYFWVRLPRSLRTGPTSQCFQRALQHDVLYVPGCFTFGPDPTRRAPDCHMRLSYGGATPAAIRLGIQRLGAALRESGPPSPRST